MTQRLIWLGAASVPVYLWATLYGALRPDRIIPFFVMFGVLFALYGVAVWIVLRAGGSLSIILGFAILFNLILLPSLPTLSDDMYRYIWDGRVQAAGINPYRYPSNAPELAPLRDDAIWARMNRLGAITVYPPGAEAAFAVLWRLVPDSIVVTKLIMIGSVFACGGLLTMLLRALGEAPARVLILLWNPLLVFEIAHSAHVDALYLPLIVGAMLVRARSVQGKLRDELVIGFLLGLAILVKLYPAILIASLWSVRDTAGCRRWRLALPAAAGITVAVGYGFYMTPGVNTLGFLPQYSREFFNLAPPVQWLMNWAPAHGIDFYKPVLVLMPLSVILVSIYFLVVPARTARQAILRCIVPISLYLLISQNLFPWYVLWILPLVALTLHRGSLIGFLPNTALAWWIFSGLVVLSYTLFITGYAQFWASWAQFIPLYALLVLAGGNKAKEFLWPVVR